MLMCVCGPERPQISSVYMGECSECSFSRRIAEPVAQFADLRFVAVIQMLRRAEDLDRRNPRAIHAVQPGSGQPVVDDDVCG